MEFYDVVNARRTVRELKDDSIPADVLERIITAGLTAPTHNHQREWEFIVLRTQEEKENALQFVKQWSASQEENNAVSALGSSAQRMYAYAMPRQYFMLAKSGCVILPFFRGSIHATSINGLNSFASIWCVIENIFLAATAEGLAYAMRIPVGDEGNKVAQAVGSPFGWLLPCYIALGYPAEGGKAIDQINRDVKSVLHFGKW